MKEQIISALTQHKYKLETTIDTISRLEDDPFLFFNEDTGLDNVTLMNLVCQNDIEKALDFQQWLYPKIIDEIAHRYNMGEFSLIYQQDLFPGHIQFVRNMQVEASIDPFNQSFVYQLPNGLSQAMVEKHELLIQLAQINEEIELCELIEANPVIAGRGQAWGTTKALFSQKKVKEENKKTAIELLDQSRHLKMQLNDCSQKIETMMSDWQVKSLDVDRLAKRMSMSMNLTIINLIDELQEEESGFLMTELPRMREEYRQQLRSQYGLNEIDIPKED